MTNASPYIGPRPFERNEDTLFFGRDREVSELLSLVISHRALLLYAQSGAGKTSLINASLLPQLEDEEFTILPVVRVRGLIPENLQSKNIDNVYVFNTLASWREHDESTAGLEKKSLTDGLADFINEGTQLNQHSPVLLIFDQFEELFTAYPERWQDRRHFFQQLGDALDKNPLIHIMFVMREEYIAQLQPFVRYLPEKLRTRYRLECLKRTAALAAVKGPLNKTDRTFKADVAETLVDDLLKSRVETLEGELVVTTGEFAEPVQLQVVCQSLWEALPPDAVEISADDLQYFGDVNQALQTFYENSLQRTIQATAISEGVLRGWFRNTLITPVGTRGTVYRGIEKTGGIPNDAVDILESVHLVRGEFRAGSRWYELTHDRFIEPILTSNQTWDVEHREGKQTRQWLKERTLVWLDSNRAHDKLLEQDNVARAENWLEGYSSKDDKDNESLFAYVNASRAAIEHARAEAKERAARRLWLMVFALIGLIIVAIGFANIAFRERKAADKSAEEAMAARDSAQVARDEAVYQANIADSLKLEAERVTETVTMERDNAELQRNIAERAQDSADSARAQAEQARTAAISAAGRAERAKQDALEAQEKVRRLYDLGSISRVLSQESSRQLQKGDEELAALLARQAYLFDKETGHNFQDNVYNALREVMNSNIFLNNENSPVPVSLWQHTNWIRDTIFHPGENTLYSCSNDGTILSWPLEKGLTKATELAQEAFSICALALDSSTDDLFYGTHNGEIKIINPEHPTEKPRVYFGHNAAVLTLAFNSDRSRLASVGADCSLVYWRSQNSELNKIQEIKHSARIKSLAFLHQRNVLFAGNAIGELIHYAENESSLELEPIETMKGHDGAINSIAIDGTGEIMASAGYDKTVRLWKINMNEFTLEEFKVLRDHTRPISSVAFNPKYPLLATGSYDKTVRLWNLKDLNKTPIVLDDHNRWILTLAFSSNGDTLAVGDADETIYLWPTQIEDLADKVCEKIDRNLTMEEWTQFIGETIPYEQTCKSPPLSHFEQHNDSTKTLKR